MTRLEMKDMIGYRTFIVAALAAVSGLAARYGFKFDPGIIADAAVVIIPALMAIMRTITRGPVGEKKPW